MNKEILKSSMDWDEFFMRHVYLCAQKSKDPRTKISAILVKDNIIISEGFNGFARGVKDFKERYYDRDTKLTFICHGEFNSVLNAARNGISTLNSICYTQGISCINCTKTLIQAGIKELVVHHQWPTSEKWVKEAEISKIMFYEAGINIRYFDKILNLVGYSNDKKVHI